jgi:hypothetical protein
MKPEKRRPWPAARLPVFTLCCWALGLMAFSQLLIAGMALSTRFEESRVVRTVIKEVPKLVAVRIPAPGGNAAADLGTSVISRPPVAAPPSFEASLPPPTPMAAPPVDDPRSERMVKEARQARVAGDMGIAIMKLEEALSQSPDDPSVHFELGLVHEQMGVFDTASMHYEKVFQMGISGAGSLYERAATKLRDGFEQPSMLGKLSLARVRDFKDPRVESGERVILDIPVQKAPGQVIDAQEVSVSVHIFNRTTRGEIVLLEDQSWAQEQWISEPCDWEDGEETLRITYTIPPQDEATNQLFGERSYYGQVVTLHYGEEVIDVLPWPRDLAAKIPQQPGAGRGEDLFLPGFQDLPFPDFDPGLGVLPPLPTE